MLEITISLSTKPKITSLDSDIVKTMCLWEVPLQCVLTYSGAKKKIAKCTIYTKMSRALIIAQTL